MTGSPWAVVLAGGDGERVSALTRDARGRVVPKQFWSCGGRAPMIRWALARARRVAPPQRVLVAIREQHREFWQSALYDVPRGNVLVQPENRGTAAGVMRALVALRAQLDPFVLAARIDRLLDRVYTLAHRRAVPGRGAQPVDGARPVDATSAPARSLDARQKRGRPHHRPAPSSTRSSVTGLMAR